MGQEDTMVGRCENECSVLGCRLLVILRSDYCEGNSTER